MENLPINWSLPVPLFPLPNCVLFPGVVQPLHIFEPRYKEMISDALEGPGLLTLGLLKEGWEKNYYGKPPVHEMVCLGKIVAHEQVEDGKYNLLLHGVARARIIGEHMQGAYRTATVQPTEGFSSQQPPSAALQLQRKVLRDLFAKTALKELTVTTSLDPLFEDSLGPGHLIDALSFTLVQDVATKQRLLEELDPLKRGELLMRELVLLAKTLEGQVQSNEESGWPPSCSSN